MDWVLLWISTSLIIGVCLAIGYQQPIQFKQADDVWSYSALKDIQLTSRPEYS